MFDSDLPPEVFAVTELLNDIEDSELRQEIVFAIARMLRVLMEESPQCMQ